MKQPPSDFTDSNLVIMSNFDGKIDNYTATTIKDRPLYAGYTGWNFYGRVWWENGWHCLIMTFGTPRETFTANSLEEIMQMVSDQYGHK